MGEMLISSAYESAANSHATLQPEWGLREERRTPTKHLRSLTGHSYTASRPTHTRLTLPLRFVPDAQREFLNGLWESRAPVAVTLDSSHNPSTILGVLANMESPLGDRESAYGDRWRGELVVEAKSTGRYGGQLFLLDDPERSKLNQTNLALA